jgi:hypothetical protein
MFASYRWGGLVQLLVIVGVLLTVFVIGCGDDAVDPSGLSEEEIIDDAYRGGVAQACEDSGRDDEFDCGEIARRMINPEGLPDDVDVESAQALGYVDACDNFYYGCDPREYKREAGVIQKHFDSTPPCPKSQPRC